MKDAVMRDTTDPSDGSAPVTGMRLNRRRFVQWAALGAGAVALSGLLAACGGDSSSGGGDVTPGAESEAPTTAPASDDSSPSTEDDEEWVIGLSSEPTALGGPYAAYSVVHITVESHILEGLLDIQGEEMETVPLLAESWETIDDSTWEFRIRQGVTFHNGDPLTAEDVRYTLGEIMADPAVPRHSFVSQFESVEAPDEYTVVIRTKGPYGPMISRLPEMFILPKRVAEEVGDQINRNPIGTGPYKLVEWVQGSRIVMEANPDWWRGSVSPRRLTFRWLTDPTTRMAELESGGAHIIQAVPASRLDEVANSDRLSLVAIPKSTILPYIFNIAKPPFDDVRVRRAILYGTDRAAIVDALLGEYGTLLTGPTTDNWVGFDPSVEPYPYDPDMARQLLAEAGQTNLTFDAIMTDGQFLRDREVWEAMANQLASIGVTMNLIPTERARILDQLNAGDFQLLQQSWGTRTDPDPMYSYYITNGTAYFNDDVAIQLVQDAKSTIDPDERKRIYQELFRRMADQAHWLFVYAQADAFGKQRDVDWDGFPHLGSTTLHFFFRINE